MKSLLYISIAIITGSVLFSCAAGVPIAQQKAQNNKTYEVEYLFEHEGCKVYRFLDLGDYVYFTNCNGEVSTAIGDSTRTQTINMVKSNPEK